MTLLPLVFLLPTLCYQAGNWVLMPSNSPNNGSSTEYVNSEISTKSLGGQNIAVIHMKVDVNTKLFMIHTEYFRQEGDHWQHANSTTQIFAPNGRLESTFKTEDSKLNWIPMKNPVRPGLKEILSKAGSVLLLLQMNAK